MEMGNAKFEGTQEEWDQLVAKNKEIEQQRQQVAKDLNISLEQVEVLSEEEQSKGIAIPEESSQVDSEQEFKDFLASDENKNHARQLAEQIQSVCGDKWFPIEKLLKKSAETRQTAFQKLKLCELFGLVNIRIGDWRDDRKQLREPLYKVILSTKDKMEAINRVIQYHEDQIKNLTIERSLLEDKLSVDIGEKA